MAIDLNFYDDAGLTILSQGITVTQAADGSSAPVDRVVYLGSPVGPWRLFKTEVNPDVDNITVHVVDPATGSGVEAAHIKLAAYPEDLDTAVGGAPGDLDCFNFANGVNNALRVYIRIETPALTAGVYTLSLSTNSLIEVLQ